MTEKTRKRETLIIRPPSEYRSLLIRVTRGCAWNRCKFCGLYPALGEPSHSERTVSEIKSDIDFIAAEHSGFTTAFLGDADPLGMPVNDLEAVLYYLQDRIPGLERITSYARTSSLNKLGYAGSQRLAAAGLRRLHIGLESGDRHILRFQRKGQTPEMVIKTAAWLKQADMEVSYYVLLGLGGVDKWQQHIDATAAVLNTVDPDYIRIRRIWIYDKASNNNGCECPLWSDIRSGDFKPQSNEGTVLELRRLIEQLTNVSSEFVCDHANNFVRINGRLPDDRENMLKEIDRFLSLPQTDRDIHYRKVNSRI